MRSPLLLSLLAALGLLLQVPLSAQRLHVDDDAAPGGDGSSWASAYQDLSPALAAAASDLAITEIWVAAGTYLPSASADPSASFPLRNGLAVLGGFAGNETSADQRDPAANPTVLDGDLSGDDGPGFTNYADNSWHVVTADGVNGSAVLDGFTVRGGSGLDPGGRPGAGISVVSACPTLSNLIVRENTALGGVPEGAGVFAVLTTGEMLFSGSSFVGNQTTSGAGVKLRLADALFLDCRFEDNQATNGGGLAAESSGVTLVECRFEANQATDGAGLSVEGGSVEITSTEFVANTATSGAGVTSRDADLQVLDCRFEDNVATSGGGIYVSSQVAGVLVDVVDSVFLRNRACAGGGLHASGARDYDANVRRCRFEENVIGAGCGGGSGGGAIALSGNGGSPLGNVFLNVSDCLLRDNRRGQLFATFQAEYAIDRSTFSNQLAGAGIRTAGGSGTLANSIVWGLDSLQVQGDQNLGASHSDVGNDGAVLPGPGNIEADPLFVDAASGDLRLQSASPCVDAGDPGDGGFARDLEGDSRFLDGDLDGSVIVDMGVDEFAPIHLAIGGSITPGGTLTVDTTGEPGLLAILGVGPPGGFYWPRAGVFFLDLGSSIRASWPVTPSSVPVNVPPGIPTGVPFVVQVFAFDASARTLSNPVELQF